MNELQNAAFFKIGYGLYWLSTGKDGKQNGSINNTVMQVTDVPKQLVVTVGKTSLTHELIAETGLFNVSVLTPDAPFELYKRFGYQSGRTVDKFDGFLDFERSENGLLYLTKYTNALFSGKVTDSKDLGTHTLFIADATEARILSDGESVTYQYYFDHIKPKPTSGINAADKKKGYVCKICGWIYEGDPLPPDIVCPICGHGFADFEPIG